MNKDVLASKNEGWERGWKMAGGVRAVLKGG
jgi:hypothetical protein